MKYYRGLLWVAFFFFLGVTLDRTLEAAMSDSKAITEAFKIWGNPSHVAQSRTWGDSNWTKEIGFMSPGCQAGFTVVGTGFNTWDAAFASLPPDKGIAGTYSGSTTLNARIDTANMTAPGVLQFKLDNTLIGPPLGLVDTAEGPTIKQAVLPWDSRSVPNGNHVLCAVLRYTDATSAKEVLANTHAVMIIVKQVP